MENLKLRPLPAIRTYMVQMHNDIAPERCV
jgi:hypothetical protein